jgi:hypothetical protein
VEACGYTQWFEQMLEQMGHRYQIGDAASPRASYVRRQKTHPSGEDLSPGNPAGCCATSSIMRSSVVRMQASPCHSVVRRHNRPLESAACLPVRTGRSNERS